MNTFLSSFKKEQIPVVCSFLFFFSLAINVAYTVNPINMLREKSLKEHLSARFNLCWGV